MLQDLGRSGTSLHVLAAQSGIEMGHVIKVVVESVVFVAIGILLFLLAFWLMTKLSPFSIRKEIEEDQNVALGIVIGAVLIGMAIIIAAAIGG
jgi:uncharacterized membrane protein YjfL (UPF0719 family)